MSRPPLDKAIEVLISAAIAGGIALGAIGAKSPGSRVDDHEVRIRALEEHGPKIDLAVAVLQNDVTYIKDGIDELRGHKGRQR
jgi:hypothetical protein